MPTQKQTPTYRLSFETVLKQFETSKSGLSTQKAAHLLEKNGPNALADIKSEPLWRRYLRQFQDWMILLLLASGGVSAYLGDLRTALVLFALVLFNTLIGFLQEYRAEKTMQALEKLVQAMAEVYRDGKLTEIESHNLVVGDIVRLSEGQSVPVDVRLIEIQAFSTNDFALTGESNPTRKFTHTIGGDVPVGNRHNLAYMGTTVATGEALGVVVATGMDTELGRIASLSAEAPRDVSPLQRELRHIATYVTYGVVLLSLALLMVAIQSDLPFKEALLFAVGFASSLIPQGLPAEVNTSLAQAAGKLSRARALVKKLSAVETLGATHVICTDKTGTLTKNEMTVEGIIVAGETYDITGTGYEPKGTVEQHGKKLSAADQKTIQEFVKIGLFASNAKVLEPDNFSAKWYCLGDPTEGALVTLARKAGLDTEHELAMATELRELTFDSNRKRMTSVRQSKGTIDAYVKGAPESVLERSTHIYENGKVRKITEADRQAFLQEHTRRAQLALRNLAFATRRLDADTAKHGSIDEIETELTLVGLVSMIDPIRETVPAAMRAARQAHIKVNIVTGDFALTAQAIARQAQLVDKDETPVIITGQELQAMSDADVLAQTLKGGTIFSRVSPEDKMRIVGLVKESGHVVAVTGDGINDAPALKRADIGVAMGITGTDVAKQSSELILLDDSFSTLVRAIREGRTIFANIKKGVLSCFTSNTAELVVNLISLILTSLAGIPLALNVLQLLAIDLLAELFPIAALGWDKEEGETMKQKPRDPRAHILNKHSIIDLLWCGLVIGSLAIINYLLFFDRHGIAPQDAATALVYSATTMTYVTIVACQLVNIIQRRSVHGFFTRYQFSNRYFWLAVLLSISIVLTITYVPIVSEFFKSGPIGVVDWLFVLGASVIFLVIRESQRIWLSRRSKRSTFRRAAA
jgi:P-type Ca2+ transporter type 2C